MIYHVLGGGYAQLGTIRALKRAGHTVLVTDYLPDAPGASEADLYEPVSTFDAEQCILAAKRHHADAVLTLGTDQPVLTAALEAESLGLPSCLSVEQALLLTDKEPMKRLFSEHGIPTVPYALIREDFSEEEISHIRPPYVLKPCDSQGQRGVYMLNSVSQLRSHFSRSRGYSRKDVLLLEQYYRHDELTVSGWVHQGLLSILTVTDRITKDFLPTIGVCLAHRYPSRFSSEIDEIERICSDLTSAVGVQEGPIYIQLLRGAAGYVVNEAAGRIGGAYEEYLIPAVTGVPVRDLLIAAAAGESPDPRIWFERERAAGMRAEVLLFFAAPGTVGSTGSAEELLAVEGVEACAYHVKPGDVLPEVEHASQRAGYVVMAGAADSFQRIQDEVGARLYVHDQIGRDMMLSE